MNIRDWFERYSTTGLNGFLVDIAGDLEDVDKPETRAKLKMDFVRLVEQTLNTLPHLTAGSADKTVVFNFEEVTTQEITEHWEDEDL